MPYLISLAVVAVAVLVLLGLLVRQGLRARRLARMIQVVRTHFTDRISQLKARVAVLKTALGQWRDRWRRPRPAGGSDAHPAA